LEWGVTPVSEVLHAARISLIDVIIASDLAAPVKAVPQLVATLREAFSLGSQSVQLWISCQTHREFTPALLAAMADEFSVLQLATDELHPRYVSATSRQVLCIVRPRAFLPVLPG
jgi:hypothetical protein